MQYIKPYTYFLKKPTGTKNLMWGSLALLAAGVIPIVPQMVFIGYQSEAIDELKEDPDIERYPDFDINRFVEYLTRGIWPILVQLVVTALMMALIFLVYGLAGLAWYASQEPAAGLIVLLVLVIPVSIAGAMISWPMMLHAQVSKAFLFGAMCRFTVQFLRKVGGQLLLVMIVHMLISLPLVLAGLLLCIVGMFPAATIVSMAQEHFIVQLYRMYLDEGGEPIGGLTEQLELDQA